MQKVLYIFGGEKASGAEIVMDRLMRSNKQVEPHLLMSPGDFADKVIKDNVYNVTTSNYLKKLNRAGSNSFSFIIKAIKNYLYLSAKVLAYIRKHNITIVHANTVVPASYIIPAIILSKLFFRNVIWIWTDHDLSYFSKKDELFANVNLKLFKKTLVVSNAVKAKYIKKKQLQKVAVLYNGLDTDIFKPDEQLRKSFRQKYGLDENTVIIGIAANLHERKGQLSLLNAFLNIENSNKNSVMLLAGGYTQQDLEYAQEVIKLAENYPASIKYIGVESEMVKLYNGCDIIINNSNKAGSEPLGTTIYEAMACEKIVIASDTGGTKEIIENQVDGFIFEAENQKDLTSLINYCVLNLENLSNIKLMARKKAITKFNIKVMVSTYNAILDTIN